MARPKKDNNLYLVCEVCSAGGTRVNPDAYIAIIETVEFPFKKEYCKHLHFERGEKNPFFGTDYSTYRCPRGGHSIFVLNSDDVRNFKKYEGVTRILTSEGWKEMNYKIAELRQKIKENENENKEQEIVEMQYETHIVDKTTSKSNNHAGKKVAICNICGNIYKNRDVCLKHIKAKHRECAEPSKQVKVVVKYVR
jgi:hypothetical protein